ncbi:toll/interleukin-1 receptor domain-containing protein [Acinetobacter baumannii]|nr:toll/interleukin-1 receptor domain-containing protein [Acinetobacter baumannii]
MKAFLSHSSKDKLSYVQIVAEKIGIDNIHYDEFTFEKGERSLDEILLALDSTDLFVLFISDASLNSEWVKKEISEANIRLEKKEIEKIYPIIIEGGITYEDPRIPTWLKDEYNIKPIRKPTVAARNILQKLTELSWIKHPQLEERHNLCIGRNQELENFEQRIDDFLLDKPSTIFVSGLNGIGRRTFLSEALYKTRLKKKSYKPSLIYLDSNSSIEDFILKLNDLGILELGEQILSLSDKSMDHKISLVIKILDELFESREMIYIFDDGCLVNHQRNIADWFIKIIKNIDYKYPILCCASKYKLNLFNYREDDINNKVFNMNISELNLNERGRLFKRILEIYNIDINKDDFRSVVDNLHGLPSQTMYAVSVINDKGVSYLLNNMNELIEFNNSKASMLLKKYDNDNESLDFIRFLAQFEIISISYIKSIVGNDKNEIIESLINENICELMGAYHEILRLNDVIRDYIKRNRLQLSDFYKEKIKEKTEEFLNDQENYERDSSEYIFSIKEALRSGKNIDHKLLIPSHYLKCMKDIYNDKGDSRKIIELADQILLKESSLDSYIVRDIRYYLCLALIRKKDNRFMKEVQNIYGDEHKFLLGFYYRNMGRYDDALRSLLPVANKNYISARVKREIVQCYIQMEDYENALEYAKNNYYEFKENAFHAQAYFYCLINTRDFMQYKNEIYRLVESLKSLDLHKAHEMAAIAEALCYAKFDQNEQKAIDHINDAINTYSETYYPILAKCDIAIKFRNIKNLEEAVGLLEALSTRREQLIKALNKYKAYLLALKNDKDAALRIINNDLKQYPEHNKTKIIRKIEELYERRMEVG